MSTPHSSPCRYSPTVVALCLPRSPDSPCNLAFVCLDLTVPSSRYAVCSRSPSSSPLQVFRMPLTLHVYHTVLRSLHTFCFLSDLAPFPPHFTYVAWSSHSSLMYSRLLVQEEVVTGRPI
eukprot:768205-Hanusia_phi.AAC.2